jgi:hypothetical protein
MEKACADGNVELVEQCFNALLSSSDSTVPLTSRVSAAGAAAAHESTCAAAKHGHGTVFSFFLEKGVPVDPAIVKAVFAGNKPELCQTLAARSWLAAATGPSRYVVSCWRLLIAVSLPR